MVQVRLLPTSEQASALRSTLHVCNVQANEVSRTAFERGVFRNHDLRKLTYRSVRDAGLGSQAAQHVIKKVADAYGTLRAGIRAGNFGRPGSRRRIKAESKPITFRPDAAQPFDRRNMSLALDAGTLSLWTLNGRLKGVPFACSTSARRTLAECRHGESDLLCRDGKWLLLVTVEVAEQPLNEEPDGFIGVDLGIANIATTSTGYRAAGRESSRHRARQARLRRRLQAKGTKSAKRVLKRQRRREQRRARDVNHCVSKRIVAEAERTGRGIALEDLTGIRDRVRHRRPQRAAFHSWAFHQLGNFITYKARRAGVPVVFVDPAHTSRTCADCGHRERADRVDQALFICRGCGVVAHADRNASRNIARKGEVAWDAGRRSSAPAPPRGGVGWTRRATRQPVGP
ncbi:RNA-guided endonuclease InsQ/TnpB family protein [Thermomonospora umbrina]|uniref:IS605 OrfB family transposase n=1 Tax=Thermomonospora umbrina TaxID=111806 RepID=A0A3D9SQH6_9ACTN|nr:RNA-guided endonuclease TnpB family protein [Thermomonospora umbrina]REE98028.1 IS605 OrfB family transposase [Thermomonospora umbrina]